MIEEWFFEGEWQVIGKIKARYGFLCGRKMLRDGILAGADTCEKMEEYIERRNEVAGRARGRKNEGSAVPAHDPYKPETLAFLSWRGPADGRLFGMAGL